MLNEAGTHEPLVTKGSLTYYLNLLRSEIVDSAYNKLFSDILNDIRISGMNKGADIAEI